MADLDIINPEEEQEVDYVAAIAELKNNSVSKEQYDKIKQENSRLLDALVNNKQIDIPKEEPVDIQKLRNNLFHNEQGLSNMDFIDNALRLRKALIDAGERDPFLPVGNRTQVDYDTELKAERVAQGLQEMLDFADGDQGIFNAEYQRRVVDVGPMRARRK